MDGRANTARPMRGAEPAGARKHRNWLTGARRARVRGQLSEGPSIQRAEWVFQESRNEQTSIDPPRVQNTPFITAHLITTNSNTCAARHTGHKPGPQAHDKRSKYRHAAVQLTTHPMRASDQGFSP